MWFYFESLFKYSVFRSVCSVVSFCCAPPSSSTLLLSFGHVITPFHSYLFSFSIQFNSSTYELLPLNCLFPALFTSHIFYHLVLLHLFSMVCYISSQAVCHNVKSTGYDINTAEYWFSWTFDYYRPELKFFLLWFLVLSAPDAYCTSFTFKSLIIIEEAFIIVSIIYDYEAPIEGMPLKKKKM